MNSNVADMKSRAKETPLKSRYRRIERIGELSPDHALPDAGNLNRSDIAPQGTTYLCVEEPPIPGWKLSITSLHIGYSVDPMIYCCIACSNASSARTTFSGLLSVSTSLERHPSRGFLLQLFVRGEPRFSPNPALRQAVRPHRRRGGRQSFTT